MTFDEWVFKVCSILSNKYRKEITDVYSSLDLTDAKLAYVDGTTPEVYTHSLTV